jgi:hypothetical protein
MPRGRDLVELASRVVREPDAVVGEVGRRPLHAGAHHEPARRGCRPPHVPQRPHVRQQVAVQVLSIGVDHDHVGGDRSAVRQHDAGDPVGRGRDAAHLGAGPELDPDAHRHAHERVAQRAETAHRVPAAVGLLDVSDARQGGRRLER